jgi:hypothetical protein
MSRWHAIRIRDDLYRVIQAQAAEMSRSATGQLDFVLSRALEQEANTPASSGGGPPEGVIPGESQRGADVGRGAVYRRDASDAKPAEAASSPARAPVAQRIEGQTTVDEMLASCPNCAGEMQDYCLDDGRGGGEMVKRCEDCGYVREST